MHPKIGEQYRHYKGEEYCVTGFACHSETGEKMVLYKPLYRCEDLEPEYPEGVLFARPISLWNDTVEHEGTEVQRFTCTTDEQEKEPVFVPREGQVDFTNVRWCPVINCVLHHKNKYLIVERNKAMRLYPEYWNGISGFLDDQKSLDEKVREELLEETGLADGDIASITLCGVLNQEDSKIGKTWIVHAIRVEVATDNLTFDWEAQNHKWVTKEEALQHKLLPGFDEVLQVVIG